LLTVPEHPDTAPLIPANIALWEKFAVTGHAALRRGREFSTKDDAHYGSDEDGAEFLLQCKNNPNLDFAVLFLNVMYGSPEATVNLTGMSHVNLLVVDLQRNRAYHHEPEKQCGRRDKIRDIPRCLREILRKYNGKVAQSETMDSVHVVRGEQDIRDELCYTHSWDFVRKHLCNRMPRISDISQTIAL